MAAGAAWVLNLDADLELGALGALGASERYTKTAAVIRAMRPHVELLSSMLLGPDDLLIDESTPAGSARGMLGRAFCPTPCALSLLRRAGAEPEPHPPASVLHLVNGRAFAASLGPTLPGAAFVTDVATARRLLGSPPEVGDGWRVKRAFGMAGRGQRVLRPHTLAGALADPRDEAFVLAAIAEGGAQVEPNVPIEVEYGMHGMLAADGALTSGVPVVQRCDARGQWLATERIPGALAEAHGEVPARLAEELQRVGDALHRAGYFGPFGVDAFTYRDRRGSLQLQPRSEMNARYSMGFAVGFGPLTRLRRADR